MPLVHSKSEPAFKQNVRTLMGEVGTSPHVKSRAQALAIAYATKRRGRASGGRAYDFGGFVNPAAAPVSGPATGPMPQAMAPVPQSQAPMAFSPPPAQAAPPSFAPAPQPSMSGAGSFNPGPVNWAGLGGFGGTQTPWFSGAGMAPNTFGGNPLSGAGLIGLPQGGQGFAFGGAAAPPWTVRAEARQMMHTGPVNSIVPGRTDRHNVSVRSGSYVLPADTISHLGQNNTGAGSAVIARMFGRGPFGTAAPKMGRGMGLPKPPKPMGIPSDRGGARGRNHGAPTPVVVAGGEDALSPEEVAMVGAGEGDIERGRRIIASRGMHPIDVENGHKILDAFALKVRKKHIATLKKLPPPAKS